MHLLDSVKECCDMTNFEKIFEKIKEMNIEEMADMIYKNVTYDCDFCVYEHPSCRKKYRGVPCVKGIKAWLESEAE